MVTPLVAYQQIRSLKPRHLEIIRRMMLGEEDQQICREMAIQPKRFSVIKNSPLFKLVMRQEMLKKADALTEIQENLIEGAKLGTKLNKEILESAPGQYPLEFKVKVGMVAVNQAIKMLALSSPHNGGNHNKQDGENGEELGYEERLRQVTVTESHKSVTRKLPPEEISHPIEADMIVEEEGDELIE